MGQKDSVNQEKSNRAKLDKFTVVSHVILAVLVFGVVPFCSLSKKRSLPFYPILSEALEEPEIVIPDEPEPIIVVSTYDGEPTIIDVAENDISQQDIPRTTLSEFAFMDALFPPESISDELYEHANAIIDNEGLLTRYRTVGDSARNVFMDKQFYMSWRDDPSKSNPAGSTFYLDPAFIIMEDDLNRLSAEVSEYNGSFKLQIPFSLTHKVFLESALIAVKATLKGQNVPDVDALTINNLSTIPVVRCALEVPDYGWVTATGGDPDNKIRFTIPFKNQKDFKNFKTALLNGTCQIKYCLYGQRVTPSSLKVCVSEIVKKINDANTVNDVQYDAFKAGAKTLNVKYNRHSAGDKPTYPSIFFDMNDPASFDGIVKSDGKQDAKQEVEIREDDLYKHVADIVKRACFLGTGGSETSREETNEALAIAKIIVDQGRIDTNCEVVEGIIASFNKENDSFQLILKNGLKTDLAPSETISLTDALSSKFVENYYGMIIDEKHDEGEESRNGKRATEHTAYDALVAGEIRFPIPFKFYRVGQFLVKFDEESLVNMGELEPGVYPVKNGFIAVCEEIPEYQEVFKCVLDSRAATINPKDWTKNGSGCLAKNTVFSVDAGVDVKESAISVNALDFTFKMGVTIDGHDAEDRYSSYKQSKVVKKTVKREDVVLRGNSEGGEVFHFLCFCDEKGNAEFGSGFNVSASIPKSNYNHGTCGPDDPHDYPHGSPQFDLLKHNPQFKMFFKTLKATGEYHQYYQKYKDYSTGWRKLYPSRSPSGKWSRDFKCLTDQHVKLECEPCFYFRARTQLPTIVMKSNQGVSVMIDKNLNGSYFDVDNTSNRKNEQSQTP